LPAGSVIRSFSLRATIRDTASQRKIRLVKGEAALYNLEFIDVYTGVIMRVVYLLVVPRVFHEPLAFSIFGELPKA
jgi:hypothetical protein